MRISVVDVGGEPYARGYSFGLQRRGQIGPCIADWLESLRHAGVPDPRAYIAQMLQETDFVTALRQHTPDLLDEVRGIADGAGQPFDLLLAEQLMDEEWAYRQSFLSCAEPVQKCSSAAIHARAGLTWIGQNMDLGGYTDGHQVAMRIAATPSVPGALIFTIGGMIALMGVNSRGVGICVNSLPQLPAARCGLPVAFMIRKLLQAEELAQAVEWVRGLPHATGQHYLIAAPIGVRSFEASSAGVLEYRAPNPHRVLHTNHPLAEEKGEPARPDFQVNTLARLRALTERLMTGEPDLDAIKAALSSCDDPKHPVCRVLPAQQDTNAISFTTGSLIAELRTGAAVIDTWVSAGPPSPSGYTHLQLGSMGT